MRIPLKPATDSNPNPATYSSGDQATVPVQTRPATAIGRRSWATLTGPERSVAALQTGPLQ